MRTLKMLRQLQSKNIFFLKCQHDSFLPSYKDANCPLYSEKDAENTKKATKVTLNIFRGYLQEKGLREAEFLT